MIRVHLNCAATLDGAIGLPGRKPLEISNAEDKARVHHLRAACDAVLVGVGTVLADDPKLTVKWELVGRPGRQPLRVVLDSHLRTPPHALILNGDAPTLVFAADEAGKTGDHLRVELVPRSKNGSLDLRAVLRALERRAVRSLLVEGGEHVLTSFLQGDLVDVATIFFAPRVLGSTDAPRIARGPLDLSAHLRLDKVDRIGDGVLLTFVRR